MTSSVKTLSDAGDATNLIVIAAMLTVFFIIRIMIEWWVNSTTAEVGWDGWCCIRSSWVGQCILSFGQFTLVTAFCWYCFSECHFKLPRKSSLKISCDKRKTNKNMLCIQKIIQFACLAHTWIKCEITKMCKINTKCTILVKYRYSNCNACQALLPYPAFHWAW